MTNNYSNDFVTYLASDKQGLHDSLYTISDDDYSVEAVLYREVWYQYGDMGIITPAYDESFIW